MSEKKVLSKTMILVVILLVLPALMGWANHIAVGTVTLTEQNTTSDYTHIQFDISWDNSWRTSSAPNNWDAAWVFVKYKETGGDWKHATLSVTSGDHTNPTGSTIDAVADGKGIFIYRNAVGSGSVSYPGAKLRWNYGTDGLLDAATVTVKVFAIEMVYVPEASFYVGSGGTETSAFYNYPTTTNAYQITNENVITVGTADGNLYYPSSTYGGDQNGPIPAAFPNGYNAFYCMKYEISQQQYVDFLNTLTQTQATPRKYTGSTNRYAITGSAVGSYTTANPYVACNYLSWADGAAYSDWAGLRPMTELEFEKAGRGTLVAIANEYAWGTTTIASSAYTLSNAGANNEGIATNYSTTAGNVSYSTTDGSIDGPLRVGIFAANGSNTGRTTSGSSYYGIMELSGNLWERPVTLGNTDGRAFTGLNGDGELTTDGNADVSNWPGTTASGSGFRGGNCYYSATYLLVSNRYIAAYTEASRYYFYGFRSARTQ